MRLLAITASNKQTSGGMSKSRVLVNMDKFVDAVECVDGLINMWFEGPFSLTVTKEDLQKVLLDLGICQREVPAFTPGRMSPNNNF